MKKYEYAISINWCIILEEILRYKNMKKSAFFILGAICALSCGAISFSPEHKVARADGVVNIEGMKCSLNAADTPANNGIYLFGEENAAPYPNDETHQGNPSWDITVFTSNESSALTFNGTNACTSSTKIKKISASSYYLDYESSSVPKSSSRTKDDRLIIQGNWSATVEGTTYNLSIKPLYILWNGSKWEEEVQLEPFDKVTLKDAAYDDFDRVTINHEELPSVWNTFAVSEQNTRKSFAFEFVFEAYGDMSVVENNELKPKALDIRIGSSGAWDTGHFYKFNVCNVWGDNGVLRLAEHNNSGSPVDAYEVKVDLSVGLRNTIEVGSIYIKDSDNTFDYIKYNGAYVFQIVKTPASHERTTKVGLYYALDNIFLGSSMPQKENVDEITFNRTNGNKGIYLNGPQNDIPVSGWDVRGIPASKYNALVNGEPLYGYNLSKNPLAKHGTGADDNYYLTFDDFGITFKEGDVVTISGEFHFRHNNKNYVMSIIPVSFLYTNGVFEAIEDIHDHLYEQLEAYVMRDCYADEQLAEIDAILLEAKSALPLEANMKALWDLYNDYISQIDAIPFDEEKAQPVIQAAREKAINELSAYVDDTLYDDENLLIVQGYVNSAIEQINVATTIKAINQIVSDTKTLIATIPTRQESIEEKILSTSEGYEEYLEDYDVATTTDLCAVGSLGFYSDDRSYSSGNINDFSARVATSKTNENGNLIFQFIFRSNDPSSSKYGAPIYIRLRGEGDKCDATCYRYSISKEVGTGYGVSLDATINDVLVPGSVGEFNANFQADTDYKIECGSIDLKDYDRTFIFIKVDGEFRVKKIIDSLPNEPKPTVRIIDSKTGDEDAVTTMSPVEEGTTKLSNSKLIGRLVLDESSNNESLSTSLRSNNIPNGSDLYPLEVGAFKVNGQEVNSYKASTYLTKEGTNKYNIVFNYEALEDGDTIYIGGCFASFDSSNAIKSVYRLFETVFTYHASSNSWEQDQADLDVAKVEAKETIESYLDLANYSDSSAETIQEIIDSYTAQIEAASSNEEVEALLEEALGQLNAIPTILTEYKEAAKLELQNYKSKDLFREEEQAELANILKEAFTQIDNCSDKNAVDLVVREAKQSIDALKTSAERDAEDLVDAKRVAKADLESYVGLLDMDRYSDENINLIQNLALEARNNIDNATSIDEVNNILNNFKEAIKNVKTKDGSKFDGESYISPSSINNNAWLIPVIAGSSLVVIGAIVAVIIILKKKKAVKA